MKFEETENGFEAFVSAPFSLTGLLTADSTPATSAAVLMGLLFSGTLAVSGFIGSRGFILLLLISSVGFMFLMRFLLSQVHEHHARHGRVTLAGCTVEVSGYRISQWSAPLHKTDLEVHFTGFFTRALIFRTGSDTIELLTRDRGASLQHIKEQFDKAKEDFGSEEDVPRDLRAMAKTAGLRS